MLRRGDVSWRLGPPVSECGKKQRGTPQSPRDNNMPRKQPPPSPGRGTRKQGRGHQIRMQRSVRSRCQGKGQRKQDKSRGPPRPDGRPGRRPVSSEPPLHTGVYHLTGNTHSPWTDGQGSTSVCKGRDRARAAQTHSPRSSPETTTGGSASRVHAEPRGQVGARAAPCPGGVQSSADNSGQDELWKPDLLTELLKETRGSI